MEQTDPPAPETSAAITATLALATLLASLGTSIANIALPTLAAAFSAPFAQVQAVVVAYLAALTVSVLIAGRLGDRHGLKPMLVAGLAIFAGASLLCAVAPSLWLLIGARMLQGIGAAFLMTLALALMRQSASTARIGRAMGLLGTASALGTALGPPLGGLLVPLAGWRGLFGVQVPLAGLALFLTLTLLPGQPAPHRASPARRQSPTRPATPAATHMAGRTARGFSSFCKGMESLPRRAEASLARISGMPRGLVASLVINGLVAAVMMATLVVGPFFLSLALGLEPHQVGLVMAVGPVISIISGVPSGRLVDAWGSRRILGLGLVLLTAGSFLLALAPTLMTGIPGYLFALVVLTPGYQLFQAANNTAALADVPADRRGTVSGALSLARNLGLIAGASLMGAVFAAGAGTATFTDASAADIGAGMRLTFLLAGGLMLVAFGIASRSRPPAGQ